jgi:hypothetical protein
VEAFRSHHIPEVVMDRKADEFRHLKMGGMLVQEYANRYQELMRYVPDDTDTEKKKVYRFLEGSAQGDDTPLVRARLPDASLHYRQGTDR